MSYMGARADWMPAPLIEDVFRDQKEFQRLMQLPIDSEDPETKNRLAEIYLFKLIEEVVELRKTQPSGLVIHKKTPKIDRSEMLAETADVAMFLIDFMIVREITVFELMMKIKEKQSVNFAKRQSQLLEEKLREESKEDE